MRILACFCSISHISFCILYLSHDIDLMQCVAPCGDSVGFQVRAIACSAGGICPHNKKPITRRSCLVEDLLAGCADGKYSHSHSHIMLTLSVSKIKN